MVLLVVLVVLRQLFFVPLRVAQVVITKDQAGYLKLLAVAVAVHT
jgi:hypothetical protein